MAARTSSARSALFGAGFLCTATLLGCPSNPVAPPATPTCNLATLSASGATLILVGQQTTLSYSPVQNSGSSCTAAQLAGVWSSGTPAVASVAQTGVVTGLTPGVSRITVDLLSKSAFVDVQVNPTPTATIVIAPATPFITAGATQVMTATCYDSGGLVTPCTPTINWSMFPNAFASVSSAGVVTALSVGSVNVTATAGSLSASTLVTVTPAAAGPIRVAYALTDQPLLATPAEQFNGLGGAITVSQLATGQYTVTLPGFGGGAGESRIPFVNAVNAGAVVCLAVSWNMIGVTDATVRVDCSTPGGTLTDSRFTIFAAGQGGLPGRFAFANSGALPGGTSTVTLGSGSAWSSGGSSPQLTRDAINTTGRFLLNLRLSTGALDVPVAQPAGATGARCELSSWSTSQDIVCFGAGSAGLPFVDAQFSGMLLDQGRAGKRFGAVHSSLAAISRNSAGSANPITPLGGGQYTVTFNNLGRTSAGQRETVLVTTHALSFSAFCNPSSWSTVGTNLVVSISCFNGAGAGFTLQDLVVVVIE